MGEVIPFPRRNEIEPTEYLQLRENEAGEWWIDIRSPDWPSNLPTSKGPFASQPLATLRAQFVMQSLGHEVPVYVIAWRGDVA